jgi:TfoX/Sxy family transcriptional regulator of competence genes
MAWIKIPAENHPLFLDALPKDPRISTLKMFGGIAGIVNGNMFSGLFARSVMVKLSEADQQEALAIDGTAPFDPMDNGRVMKDTLLLGEEVMDDPQVLRDWLRRSFELALTLPRKAAKAKPAAKAKKPAAKAKPAAKVKKPAAKAKNPAAKRKR